MNINFLPIAFNWPESRSCLAPCQFFDQAWSRGNILIRKMIPRLKTLQMLLPSVSIIPNTGSWWLRTNTGLFPAFQDWPVITKLSCRPNGLRLRGSISSITFWQNKLEARQIAVMNPRHTCNAVHSSRCRNPIPLGGIAFFLPQGQMWLRCCHMDAKTQRRWGGGGVLAMKCG